MLPEGGARVPSDTATVPVGVLTGATISERLQKFDPGVRSEAAPVENVPLKPGDVLGHCRILGRLGSGGMGDIHRALDLQLEREVALKVALEPVASDHDAMLREARALAALNHPNVVTVHEVGVHEGCAYLVMELLRGETLRSRMDRERPSLEEAFSWACDVLRGLSAAHSARIVHLDIKPENVFLTRDGPLKLIDFGIAQRKRTGVEEPDGIAGTIAYMAPEQLLGDPLDCRADIFAFGILLHELVTGRHPFRRPNVGATMHALLQGDFFQDGAASDPEVEAIVRACMELEPSARPPSCAHVLEDLQRVLRSRTHAPPAQATLVANRMVASARTHAPPAQAAIAQQATLVAPTPKAPAAKNNRLLPILGIGLVAIAAAFAVTVGSRPALFSPTPPRAPASIVVLPVTTVGDPSNAYFSAGVTEDITSMLARAPDILVHSNSAALAYKDRAVDAQKIGRELSVGYVLEGSVRKEDRQVRVTARLVDAQTGTDVWAERLDRASADPWALQDEIAGRIVGALTGEYGQLKRAQYRAAWGTDSTNIDEYDFYLRGHELYMRITPDDNDRAGEVWRSGHLKFPNSPLLKTKLGFHHFMRPFLFFRDGAEADYKKAGELARSALAEPHLSPLENRLAHWLFAYVSAQEGDHDRALRETETTLALAPYDARARAL